ncbi:MAG: GGDEF domain-containing protein [Chloroflexi bacterium]|nr:GGDEF domain-containing protein [Chloroflexota bacterium]
MTGRALQRPALLLLRSWRGAGDPAGSVTSDLSSIVDPRATLPKASAVLLVATLPVVALTGAGQVGPGFAFSDIVALLVGYAVAMVALVRVPWTRFPPDWSWALVAVQLLFVVSLTTMTGGGGSPYFGLYAPTLAIAGWHLRAGAFALVVSALVILEGWRAVGVDRTGSFEQLTIALPFFAALGLLTMILAQRLAAALVAIRHEQRCTADTLDAVYHLASDLSVDPLPRVADAARRMLGGRASSIAIEPAVPTMHRPFAIHERGRLTIPISGATTTYALLSLRRDGDFSNTERRLASILANTGGRAIDAHRLYQTTRGTAELDALTGLRNRRSLDDDMRSWVAPALQAETAVTIVFLDIDGLKAVNDEHGHHVGDALIVGAARALSSAIRAEDRVYRVGGDEFVVVALGLSNLESRRLRDRLARTKSRDRRVQDEGPSQWLMSAGLSRGSGPAIDPFELLTKADRAMYLAKRSIGGRGPGSR